MAAGSARPLVPVGGTNRDQCPPFSPGWCHEPGLKALLYKSTLRKFSTYLASCPRRRQAARARRRRPLLVAVAPRPCLDGSPPGARRLRPAPTRRPASCSPTRARRLGAPSPPARPARARRRPRRPRPVPAPCAGALAAPAPAVAIVLAAPAVRAAAPALFFYFY